MTTGPDEPRNFEEHLAVLEKAIRDLESGAVTLDESIACYERGFAAWRRCHEILEGARRRVEVITKGPDGEPRVRPHGTNPNGE